MARAMAKQGVCASGYAPGSRRPVWTMSAGRVRRLYLPDDRRLLNCRWTKISPWPARVVEMASGMSSGLVWKRSWGNWVVRRMIWRSSQVRIFTQIQARAARFVRKRNRLFSHSHWDRTWFLQGASPGWPFERLTQIREAVDIPLVLLWLLRCPGRRCAACGIHGCVRSTSPRSFGPLYPGGTGLSGS